MKAHLNGRAGGWRPLHHAAREHEWRLRDAKAVTAPHEVNGSPWSRGLLLPSEGCGHGAWHGSADRVPQCGDWNTMRGYAADDGWIKVGAVLGIADDDRDTSLLGG